MRAQQTRRARVKPEVPLGRRFMRIEAVLECTGWRKSRLYEAISKGEFPKPIPLSETGHAVAWSEAEIIAWQDARIAARDGRLA